MSGVVEHFDALIGGLLAVPDVRTKVGDAVWTYIGLLKAANHRGVVCKRADLIAGTLGLEEAGLLGDLEKLSEIGLVRSLSPAPYLVIQLALWPGNGGSPDVQVAASAAQRPAVQEEARVSSSDAAAAASATQPEDGGQGEGGALLARVLAVLGPEADANEMRDLVGAHPPDVVERALRRVEATPARQIRRSKTALFRYLLTKLNMHP